MENAWPTRYNSRMITCFLWNGKAQWKPKCTWMGMKWAEDMHFTLQYLTAGYSCAKSTKWVVYYGAAQTKGGCSTQRTLVAYNIAMERFEKRWPNYVKIKPTKQKGGAWKGQDQNKVRVSWRKAWLDGQTKK